jgi:hypothetical protein
MMRRQRSMVYLCFLLVLAAPFPALAFIGVQPCVPAPRADIFPQDSPLRSIWRNFFTEGYTFNVDARLTIAIAGAESSYGRTGQTCISRHNAWGWMPSGTCQTFSSWAAGLHHVTERIANGNLYFTQNRKTVPDIGSVWCPPGSGRPECAHWVPNVSSIIRDLQGWPNSPLHYGSACCGDCDMSQQVTVDEVLAGVAIALDLTSYGFCPAADGDKSGTVHINELVSMVFNVLRNSPCVAP